MPARSVAATHQAIETLEGEGFAVRRPFPTRALDAVDPFLLLDEMGPRVVGPGEAKGAPDHPHRGFETVTYVIDGRFEHKDSQGNTGRLGPGDVQWMTAGAGVVHSEMPESTFARTGGRLHLLQLWVNLPRRDKRIPPRYQDVPADRIPAARSPDGRVRVRVIAGEALGARAVIETQTPIAYLHVAMEPGAHYEQPMASTFNAFAYVLGGRGTLGRDAAPAERGQLLVFARDGDSIVCAASPSGPFDFIVVGGEPLDEPVARYGPFVMNTPQEIRQAIEDYRAGRMGVIG